MCWETNSGNGYWPNRCRAFICGLLCNHKSKQKVSNTQTYKTQDIRGNQQQVTLNCYSTRITNTGAVGIFVNASLLLNVGDSMHTRLLHGQVVSTVTEVISGE
jgi:hypothetical protein